MKQDPMKKIPSLMCGFLLSLLPTGGIIAQTDNEPDETLGIYERLDEFIPADLVFYSEDYDTVLLKGIIDKPTVLALVYYNCPGICSPLIEGVAEVISRTDLEIGTDYQVFTISFDPSEKPRLAKDKKKNYVKLVKNKEVSHGWTFFTGDSVNINKLLNSTGYKIKPAGKDWIHPAALIVLSPEGKITRYLHGLYFLPFDLKMAVVEASKGKSGPTINKVLRFCFSYDPEGKKYVLNITKVSGTIILVLAVLLFSVLFFKKRKPNTKVKQD